MRFPKTFLVVATLLLLSSQTGTAHAATQSVAIGDNAFSPATKTVNRGDKVIWTNGGFNGHTSTGSAPLNFWSSPTLAHNKTFTTPVALTAAGTYPYKCTVHFGMAGKIQVPLSAAKSGKKITLTLASAASGANHKFVLQRKNGSNFTTIATVTTSTFVFNAPSSGTYVFRSALQKNGTTAPATFFSLPLSVTV